jgi:uncharacterized protein
MALPASPSVVVIENDLSIYTPNVQSSVVGIVGFADKGPVNKATLITDQNSLLNTFGKPRGDIPGQGLEGALEILEATDQVYFVRAANATAAEASSIVTLGACPSLLVSSNLPSVSAGFSIAYTLVDNYGTSSSKTVSLASSTGNTTVNSIFTQYFGPRGQGDQDITAVEDPVSGVFLVGKFAGKNSKLSVSSSVSGVQYRIVDISGNAADPSVSAATALGFTASSTGASSLYLLTRSVNPGTGYNLTTNRDGTIAGVSVEIENQSYLDRLVVNTEGAQKEQFTVSLSPSSTFSVEFQLTDDESLNKSEFIYSNIQSNGTAYAMPDDFYSKLPVSAAFINSSDVVAPGTPRFVKLVEGTYPFDGGESGYDELVDDNNTAALVGSQTNKTGVYALDDDAFEISIAIVPGVTTAAVQNELITLAETSQNFIAVVSPPYAVGTVQDAVDWMNGRTTLRRSAINSSYAAVYWPWLQTFNYYSGGEEWYDPAIFAVRQMVYTDNVAEPWFAPAGFRRGRLTKPLDTELLLNQGDKNTLYSNNVNPVTKESQNGIIVMGQKTAQRAPTSLDRVNVRRLMIYIKKTLLQLGVPFQFEPSDPLTWELVEDAIRPFLSDLQARRGIVEGDVKCDKSTNTPLRTDRNELWCDVAIKPTKAAETIVFQVNLTNQSATING